MRNPEDREDDIPWEGEACNPGVKLRLREDREANALACCVYRLNSTRGYARTPNISLIVKNREK